MDNFNIRFSREKKMRVKKRHTLKRQKQSHSGNGLVNSIINKVPIEMHLPGYQYCGMGTKVAKRLARGQSGINPLDSACRDHDIAYTKHTNGKERLKADRQLLGASLKRIKSGDASFGEKAAAVGVSAAMKAKIGLSKIGLGLSKTKEKRKKIAIGRRNVIQKKQKIKMKKNIKRKSFTTVTKSIKQALHLKKPIDANHAIETALAAAKKSSSSTDVHTPRIIPIPKTGGMLPLIPIFAGLSALGTLAGGSAGVVRAIGAANEAKRQLSESQRHNEMMEAIAIGKSKRGNGLYLKPYRNGYGLYLKPYALSKNV